MTPEQSSRVFELLFTTKPRGIDLGLTFSQRYVEQNKVMLMVESDIGKGSTFRLTVPSVSWIQAGRIRLFR